MRSPVFSECNACWLPAEVNLGNFFCLNGFFFLDPHDIILVLIYVFPNKLFLFCNIFTSLFYWGFGGEVSGWYCFKIIWICNKAQLML